MAAIPDPVPTPILDNLSALASQLTAGTLGHDVVSLLIDRDPADWNDALTTKIRSLIDEEAAGLRDGSA